MELEGSGMITLQYDILVFISIAICLLFIIGYICMHAIMEAKLAAKNKAYQNEIERLMMAWRESDVCLFAAWKMDQESILKACKDEIERRSIIVTPSIDIKDIN